MATLTAKERAAQAWCTPLTSDRVMDVVLCEAFADIIDDYRARVVEVLEAKIAYYNAKMEEMKNKFLAEPYPRWQNALWEFQAFRDEYVKLKDLVMQVKL